MVGPDLTRSEGFSTVRLRHRAVAADILDVETRRWSREDIGALAQGCLVFQRDALAVTVPLPAWLAAASAGEWWPNASETVEFAHPEDRVLVVDSFLTALGQPGVPCTVRVRTLVDGVWSEVDMTWLNQLDNEDVAAQIGIIGVLGPTEPPEPEAEDNGEGATTSWLLIELDRVNTILSARGPVESTLGYGAEDLVGRTFAHLLHTSTLADSVNDWMAILANPRETRIMRRPFVRADGTDVWFEASFLHQDSGNILVVLIDITERLAHERETTQLNEQLSLLADSMPTALVRCDSQGRVLFHNARWADLTGVRGGGTRLHDIVGCAEAPRLDAALAAAFAAPASEHLVVELDGADGVDGVDGADGGSVWAITLQPVGEPAADRIIIASVGDATDTIRLRRAARQDGLTGLLNRSAIEERITEAMAEESPCDTLIVFVDLDRFKVVNDTFGHEAGDTVLRAVASRLRATVRPGDDIGRFGGDEFVIVCRDLAPGAEGDLMTRLTAALDEPVDIVGTRWYPAASFGCSRARPGDELSTVLRRADLAMFDAKRARSMRHPA
jgi:diguanylate cyclase (GGDEF)-like protein/PAS domain S-box-containing protein